MKMETLLAHSQIRLRKCHYRVHCPASIFQLDDHSLRSSMGCEPEAPVCWDEGEAAAVISHPATPSDAA